MRIRLFISLIIIFFILISCSSDKNTYDKALESFKNENYKQSLELLNKIKNSNKLDPAQIQQIKDLIFECETVLMFMKVDSLIQVKNFELAKKENAKLYKKFEKLDFNKVKEKLFYYYYFEGIILSQIGELDEWIKQFETALIFPTKNYKRKRFCYGMLAIGKAMKGDFNNAKKYMDKAIELFPYTMSSRGIWDRNYKEFSTLLDDYKRGDYKKILSVLNNLEKYKNTDEIRDLELVRQYLEIITEQLRGNHKAGSDLKSEPNVSF